MSRVIRSHAVKHLWELVEKVLAMADNREAGGAGAIRSRSKKAAQPTEEKEATKSGALTKATGLLAAAPVGETSAGEKGAAEAVAGGGKRKRAGEGGRSEAPEERKPPLSPSKGPEPGKAAAATKKRGGAKAAAASATEEAENGARGEEEAEPEMAGKPKPSEHPSPRGKRGAKKVAAGSDHDDVEQDEAGPSDAGHAAEAPSPGKGGKRQRKGGSAHALVGTEAMATPEEVEADKSGEPSPASAEPSAPPERQRYETFVVSPAPLTAVPPVAVGDKASLSVWEREAKAARRAAGGLRGGKRSGPSVLSRSAADLAESLILTSPRVRVKSRRAGEDGEDSGTAEPEAEPERGGASRARGKAKSKATVVAELTDEAAAAATSAVVAVAPVAGRKKPGPKPKAGGGPAAVAADPLPPPQAADFPAGQSGDFAAGDSSVPKIKKVPGKAKVAPPGPSDGSGSIAGVRNVWGVWRYCWLRWLGLRLGTPDGGERSAFII